MLHAVTYRGALRLLGRYTTYEDNDHFWDIFRVFVFQPYGDDINHVSVFVFSCYSCSGLNPRVVVHFGTAVLCLLASFRLNS